MLSDLRRGAKLLVFLAPVVCASCLSMTMPKKEPWTASDTSSQETEAVAVSDNRIVDTWELLYQVDESGEQQLPREGTRTLVEFTPNGRLIYNRVDRTRPVQVSAESESGGYSWPWQGSKEESPPRLKTQTGTYRVQEGELNVTDGTNNTRWPYRIVGDTLVIVIPKKKKQLHFRRFR